MILLHFTLFNCCVWIKNGNFCLPTLKRLLFVNTIKKFLFFSSLLWFFSLSLPFSSAANIKFYSSDSFYWLHFAVILLWLWSIDFNICPMLNEDYFVCIWDSFAIQNSFKIFLLHANEFHQLKCIHFSWNLISHWIYRNLFFKNFSVYIFFSHLVWFTVSAFHFFCFKRIIQ